ncbi:MAG: hypothetical protein B6244_13835 [Candidatus Cloacimonetes bacterium 4572_55]|nr:MAG: hypothetical protein B6244_13835 [Candidatus Cloacimonetes bacterium 4572_55]
MRSYFLFFIKRGLLLLLMMIFTIQCVYSPTETPACPDIPAQPSLNIALFEFLLYDSLTDSLDSTELNSLSLPFLKLEPESEHEANRLVENCLSVYFLEHTRIELNLDSNSSDMGSLRYHVQDIRVDYQVSNSLSPFSPIRITRRLTFTVNLKILDSQSNIIYFSKLTGAYTDKILQEHIPLVESEPYDFTQAEYTRIDKLRRFEPALIFSIIGSVVYLFYEARNE